MKILALSILALAGCATSSPAQHGITEIIIDRSCFGCATGSVVTLRSDGTVTRTKSGSERHGTSDVVSQSTMSVDGFNRLAQRFASSDFFELEEEYSDPELADGTWVAVSVRRSGGTKKVIARNDAGPSQLYELISAVDAVLGASHE
jgi:hypothetical protein